MTPLYLLIIVFPKFESLTATGMTYNNTIILMHNYLRKSTNFKIIAKKILILVYF
jgi:hypothetical protein